MAERLFEQGEPLDARDTSPPSLPPPVQGAEDPVGWTLEKLYACARGDELAVLDALTERAGLMWPCNNCTGWRNPTSSDRCGSCGQPKAPARTGEQPR